MAHFKPKHIGIILGTFYGLLFRVVLEFDALQKFGGLVSLSFLFLVPFIIGFIRVHFELNQNKNIRYQQMATIAWQPIFICLLVSVITLLEGSICVLIATPAFMFSASLGGMAAGFVRQKFHHHNNTLSCVVVLPLFIAPLENNYLSMTSTYEVSNSIIIDAFPSKIWAELGNVNHIFPDELPFSFTALIGVPSPISADMSGQTVGSVRTSTWEKNVVFKEVITEWTENKKMAYRFEIDPDLIPNDALDKHVKIGGEYFAPLTGSYQITPLPNGKSQLTLSTTIRDNTNFGIYSRIWGEFIFGDFHSSLLELMKSRSEKSTG
ncbi:hypothetical protein KO525_02900 [Psychrosphaera sp. B3R10]|uniref:hypothetical protein n=2 Tax=Psychrosphaera TaxID=907197 RepID=UPI001C08A24E|nr:MULTISPECIES: hypothetical protein [unclassified Psychrosphaera]MBU2988322.1 hypothetical protein [Psychrosphaera sp. B3R10]MDO6718532.1 hypothetical protein [Psychrosphaera sp. 1_MG-2023]